MPDHAHLTFELLDALEAGDTSKRPAIQEALAGPCPRCLAVLADYLDRPATANVSYRGLWRRVQERLPVTAAAVRRETADARASFEEFARHAPADRQRLLTSDPRFAERAFVDLLLDAARVSRRSDPAASLAWATDALTALDRQREPSSDQRVLALALQANAHRAAADLLSASRGFAWARAVAEEFDDDLDLDTLAELDSLEASLLIDLRRFEEAEALLTQALDTYQELGQVTLAGRTLIKLGHLFSTADAPEVAVGPYEAALDLLSRSSEPALHLAARFNLAHTLVDLGRIIEARDLLTYDEDLYAAHADDHTTIRHAWLQARIAAATDEPAEAEALFLQTRDDFAARADGFDAALVSLDLALLYQRLGRTQDLLATVSSAVKLFSAYALHREGLAALITLRDAVHQQAANADTIQRVASFLHDAAKDPAARFQPPS